MTISCLKVLCTLLLSLLLSVSILAQVTIPDHPLIEDGTLDAATASTTAFNSGGSISVNGKTITVPDNLIVQFPAAWVPFKDFVASGHTGKEVHVSGNIVNGKPIAAQIEVAQLLAQFGDGIIESVDTADASLKIVGGPTIRINDPNAVFSSGYTANPQFTADDENPSITAFSGFPMCIPRSASDPLCPASNRPAGKTTFAAPDPLIMAPFLAGDYIEYSGIKVGGEIICYEIVATSVQITTTGNPTYMRVEDAIIGVYDPAQAALDEFGDTRFIVYTSDASAALTISALDVDPCTGEESERLVGNAAARAGDVRNKYIWRADSTTLSRYTREYHLKLSTGTTVTKNNITAGQYVQPVTEWVFPEPLTPGIVTPAIDFSVFNFLANGIAQDGQRFGQLKPWPGATAPPAPSACATTPTATASPSGTTVATPTAFAGPDVAAGLPGSVFTLKGVNNNTAIADSDLSFTWTKVTGPTVTISGSGPTVSFTAPANSAATPIVSYEFKLTVARKDNAAINSTDNVIVTTNKATKDTVSIASYTWTTQQGGTLSVSAKTNYVIDNTAAALKLFLNPSTTALTMTASPGGIWTYQARSTKNPAGGVTVKSALGGTDTKTAVTAKKRRARREAAAARPIFVDVE